MGQYSKFGKILFLALAFLLISSTFAFALTIYVKTTGNDGLDGLSWDTAKKTIQAGLNTAVSGNEVWVAGGTYVERITLKDGVALCGGYSGVGTTRDIAVYATTIDGNQGGSVVTSPSGSTTATVIDGFTIRNASNSGIYCDSSSPTVSNNTITGNSAYSGGGICCSNSSPTIANNSIAANSASSDGGGIYCWSSSPTITNNTIAGNTASSAGGIFCASSSSPTISNNTIAGNTASYGGGIFCASSSSPTISNNTITGNSGYQGGGGIFCYSSSTTISNNTITGNTASYGDGGGIYCYSSLPAISNNIVAVNSSGIYNRGTTPVLRNNCVYGNTAYNYSGLSAGSGDISADPQFSDRANGDYHVEPTSPCVDAGSDAAVQLGWLDMDGEPRIYGAHVDIGADEWTQRVAFPAFSPSGGVYNAPQTVMITCATADAVIHYTTNGNDPTESDPFVTGPVVVDRSLTLKAKAWKTDWTPSAVKSAAYTIRVATPAFSPSSGVYNAPQTVMITCATADAVIHYTTNGSDPTESDPVVTGPVLVDRSMTLKGRAYKTDWTPSSVATAVYTLQVETPTLTPDGGLYTLPQNVTITCATPDAVIHYTTDGVDPTESDPAVTGPVLADNGMTLKARGYKTGWPASDVKSALYTVARLADRKKQPDGASVSISRAVVTGAFPELFYIQSDDRPCGIRVQLSGHTLTAGMRADVSGLMKTNPYGERYVEATSAAQSPPPYNTGSVHPLALTNSVVGGGDWNYSSVTGAGQVGVKGNANLNNIGLLLTVPGRVTYSPSSYFVISDGSNVTDPSGYRGVRVMVTGLTRPSVGQYVTVTGISSIFKSGTDYYPFIRARTQTDIVVLQ